MTVKRGPGDRLAQGRRLKAVREWKDITRADVARAVGVDPSTVTLWEKGTMPSEDRLAAVAKFLGVTPIWIRYGVEHVEAVDDHEQGAHAYLADTKKAASKKAAKKRGA